MAQFASDSFTGVDGTTLQVYSANWTRHPSYSGDTLITANRAQYRGAGSSAYYNSASPASADYSVSTDLYVASYAPVFNYTGVIGRASTSANTFYHARHGVGVGWELFRYVAGASTSLGNFFAELVAGNTYDLKLDMSGSTIKLLVNGVVTIEATDAGITAAGKAGFRVFNNAGTTSSTALHLDNFSADEAGGGGGATGTVAYTNINDVSAATGTTTVTGSSATTNANDTSAAQGATTVTGSSATTNANDISSASGSVGAAVVGTVAYTNVDDVSEAAGTTTVIGTAESSNINDTSSASGSTTVTGSSTTTNADDVSAAVGEVEAIEIVGTVAYTNADDVSAASGTTTIIGSSVTTNINDQSAAFAIVNHGTIVEAALTSATATTLRIKKPGIPVGTPDWLKTMTEIMTGRRGNKIEIPKFQTLEFSATPTQAELEALYAYTNKVRDSLDQLINRFDS